MTENKNQNLKELANDLRVLSVETQNLIGSGHLGGSYSAAELFVYLYHEEMNISQENVKDPNRDYFILSKGHASLGYYSVLAQKGFFPREEMKTYRQLNSRLQGHTEIDTVPGIESSTGSLGQGFSYAIGLAMGLKKQNLSGTVYVMLGDGECQEGQIWEAIMLQSHLKLDNLVPILDNNRIQLDNFTEAVMGDVKWNSILSSFGYDVREFDGHDFEAIEGAFANRPADQPVFLLANTVKGKGVSFMEDVVAWHSKKCDATEFVQAMEELKGGVQHA